MHACCFPVAKVELVRLSTGVGTLSCLECLYDRWGHMPRMAPKLWVCAGESKADANLLQISFHISASCVVIVLGERGRFFAGVAPLIFVNMLPVAL